MLNAGSFLGFFAIVPAFERADEVTSDAAEALKAILAIRFVAATAWTDIAFDDTREATNWVAVDWVVDGTVANASFFHMTDNCFEGFDVFAWIAIKEA